MELRLCKLRRGARGKNSSANAIEHRDRRRLGRISELVVNKRIARSAPANRKLDVVAAASQRIAQYSDRRCSFDQRRYRSCAGPVAPAPTGEAARCLRDGRNQNCARMA